jgi:hypothetical protein|tara:strand:+ start:148 stop:492 length:345 start_codon:yes stop_codon:yes gene_type:complete
MNCSRITILLLVALSGANACWFQKRDKAAKTLVAWVEKRGIDGFGRGANIGDIDRAILQLPSGIQWVVKKAGGAQAMFDRCDLNKDGRIKVDEIWQESNCLNSCWKQIAVTTFL